MSKDQTNYQVLMSAETLKKVVDYKTRLEKEEQNPNANGTVEEKAGAHLQKKLSDTKRKISDLSTDEFVEVLLRTKQPQICAESYVYGNGTDWNQTELSILGDISFAVPVDIYDNGVWGKFGEYEKYVQIHKDPTSNNAPFKGTLLFTPGALLRSDKTGKTPDLTEVLDSAGKIDQKKYNELYERRLLAVLLYANADAEKKGKKAFITTVGMGCGAFAGDFKQYLDAKAKTPNPNDAQLEQMFQTALKNILNNHGNKLKNIQCINYDPNDATRAKNESVTINGIELKTEAGNFGKTNSPLKKPGEYHNDFKDCEFYSITAWDHVSWPGNDFYKGNTRFTNDGANAAATNACMQILDGEKDKDGKYTVKDKDGKDIVIVGDYSATTHQFKPQGYRDWQTVVTNNNLQLHTKGSVIKEKVTESKVIVSTQAGKSFPLIDYSHQQKLDLLLNNNTFKIPKDCFALVGCKKTDPIEKIQIYYRHFLHRYDPQNPVNSSQQANVKRLHEALLKGHQEFKEIKFYIPRGLTELNAKIKSNISTIVPTSHFRGFILHPNGHLQGAFDLKSEQALIAFQKGLVAQGIDASITKNNTKVQLIIKKDSGFDLNSLNEVADKITDVAAQQAHAVMLANTNAAGNNVLDTTKKASKILPATPQKAANQPAPFREEPISEKLPPLSSLNAQGAGPDKPSNSIPSDGAPSTSDSSNDSPKRRPSRLQPPQKVGSRPRFETILSSPGNYESIKVQAFRTLIAEKEARHEQEAVERIASSNQPNDKIGQVPQPSRPLIQPPPKPDDSILRSPILKYVEESTSFMNKWDVGTTSEEKIAMLRIDLALAIRDGAERAKTDNDNFDGTKLSLKKDLRSGNAKVTQTVAVFTDIYDAIEAILKESKKHADLTAAPSRKENIDHYAPKTAANDLCMLQQRQYKPKDKITKLMRTFGDRDRKNKKFFEQGISGFQESNYSTALLVRTGKQAGKALPGQLFEIDGNPRIVMGALTDKINDQEVLRTLIENADRLDVGHVEYRDMKPCDTEGIGRILANYQGKEIDFDASLSFNFQVESLFDTLNSINESDKKGILSKIRENVTNLAAAKPKDKQLKNLLKKDKNLKKLIDDEETLKKFIKENYGKNISDVQGFLDSLQSNLPDENAFKHYKNPALGKWTLSVGDISEKGNIATRQITFVQTDTNKKITLNYTHFIATRQYDNGVITRNGKIIGRKTTTKEVVADKATLENASKEGLPTKFDYINIEDQFLDNQKTIYGPTKLKTLTETYGQFYQINKGNKKVLTIDNCQAGVNRSQMSTALNIIYDRHRDRFAEKSAKDSFENKQNPANPELDMEKIKEFYAERLKSLQLDVIEAMVAVSVNATTAKFAQFQQLELASQVALQQAIIDQVKVQYKGNKTLRTKAINQLNQHFQTVEHTGYGYQLYKLQDELEIKANRTPEEKKIDAAEEAIEEAKELLEGKKQLLEWAKDWHTDLTKQLSDPQNKNKKAIEKTLKIAEKAVKSAEKELSQVQNELGNKNDKLEKAKSKSAKNTPTKEASNRASQIQPGLSTNKNAGPNVDSPDTKTREGDTPESLVHLTRGLAKPPQNRKNPTALTAAAQLYTENPLPSPKDQHLDAAKPENPPQQLQKPDGNAIDNPPWSNGKTPADTKSQSVDGQGQMKTRSDNTLGANRQAGGAKDASSSKSNKPRNSIFLLKDAQDAAKLANQEDQPPADKENQPPSGNAAVQDQPKAKRPAAKLPDSKPQSKTLPKKPAATARNKDTKGKTPLGDKSNSKPDLGRAASNKDEKAAPKTPYKPPLERARSQALLDRAHNLGSSVSRIFNKGPTIESYGWSTTAPATLRAQDNLWTPSFDIDNAIDKKAALISGLDELRAKYKYIFGDKPLIGESTYEYSAKNIARKTKELKAAKAAGKNDPATLKLAEEVKHAKNFEKAICTIINNYIETEKAAKGSCNLSGVNLSKFNFGVNIAEDGKPAKYIDFTNVDIDRSSFYDAYIPKETNFDKANGSANTDGTNWDLNNPPAAIEIRTKQEFQEAADKLSNLQNSSLKDKEGINSIINAMNAYITKEVATKEAQTKQTNYTTDEHCDLSGLKFNECHFNGINFIKVNLKNTKINKCKFVKNTIDSVQLNDSKITGCTFDGVVFTDNNYGNLTIKKTSIINSQLTKADLDKVTLTNVTMTKSNLTGTILNPKEAIKILGTNITGLTPKYQLNIQINNLKAEYKKSTKKEYPLSMDASNPLYKQWIICHTGIKNALNQHIETERENNAKASLANRKAYQRKTKARALEVLEQKATAAKTQAEEAQAAEKEATKKVQTTSEEAEKKAQATSEAAKKVQAAGQTLREEAEKLKAFINTVKTDREKTDQEKLETVRTAKAALEIVQKGELNAKTALEIAQKEELNAKTALEIAQKEELNAKKAAQEKTQAAASYKKPAQPLVIAKEDPEKLKAELQDEIKKVSCKLSELNLPNIDFRGIDIKIIDFSGSNLPNTNFSNKNLTGSIFNKSNLTSSNLSKAILNNVYLIGANIEKGGLSDAKLKNAYLTGASLKDADLSGTDLTEANLKDATLDSCNFTKDTKLVGANCEGATFKNVDLRYIKTTGTNFTNADFTDAKLAWETFAGKGNIFSYKKEKDDFLDDTKNKKNNYNAYFYFPIPGENEVQPDYDPKNLFVYIDLLTNVANKDFKYLNKAKQTALAEALANIYLFVAPEKEQTEKLQKYFSLKLNPNNGKLYDEDQAILQRIHNQALEFGKINVGTKEASLTIAQIAAMKANSLPPAADKQEIISTKPVPKQNTVRPKATMPTNPYRTSALYDPDRDTARTAQFRDKESRERQEQERSLARKFSKRDSLAAFGGNEDQPVQKRIRTDAEEKALTELQKLIDKKISKAIENTAKSAEIQIKIKKAQLDEQNAKIKQQNAKIEKENAKIKQQNEKRKDGKDPLPLKTLSAYFADPTTKEIKAELEKQISELLVDDEVITFMNNHKINNHSTAYAIAKIAYDASSYQFISESGLRSEKLTHSSSKQEISTALNSLYQKDKNVTNIANNNRAAHGLNDLQDILYAKINAAIITTAHAKTQYSSKKELQQELRRNLATLQNDKTIPCIDNIYVKAAVLEVIENVIIKVPTEAHVKECKTQDSLESALRHNFIILLGDTNLQNQNISNIQPGGLNIVLNKKSNALEYHAQKTSEDSKKKGAAELQKREYRKNYTKLSEEFNSLEMVLGAVARGSKDKQAEDYYAEDGESGMRPGLLIKAIKDAVEEAPKNNLPKDITKQMLLDKMWREYPYAVKDNNDLQEVLDSIFGKITTPAKEKNGTIVLDKRTGFVADPTKTAEQRINETLAGLSARNIAKSKPLIESGILTGVIKGIWPNTHPEIKINKRSPILTNAEITNVQLHMESALNNNGKPTINIDGSQISRGMPKDKKIDKHPPTTPPAYVNTTSNGNKPIEKAKDPAAAEILIEKPTTKPLPAPPEKAADNAGDPKSLEAKGSKDAAASKEDHKLDDILEAVINDLDTQSLLQDTLKQLDVKKAAEMRAQLVSRISNASEDSLTDEEYLDFLNKITPKGNEHSTEPSKGHKPFDLDEEQRLLDALLKHVKETEAPEKATDKAGQGNFDTKQKAKSVDIQRKVKKVDVKVAEVAKPAVTLDSIRERLNDNIDNGSLTQDQADALYKRAYNNRENPERLKVIDEHLTKFLNGKSETIPTFESLKQRFSADVNYLETEQFTPLLARFKAANEGEVSKKAELFEQIDRDLTTEMQSGTKNRVQNASIINGITPEEQGNFITRLNAAKDADAIKQVNNELNSKLAAKGIDPATLTTKLPETDPLLAELTSQRPRPTQNSAVPQAGFNTIMAGTPKERTLEERVNHCINSKFILPIEGYHINNTPIETKGDKVENSPDIALDNLLQTKVEPWTQKVRGNIETNGKDIVSPEDKNGFLGILEGNKDLPSPLEKLDDLKRINDAFTNFIKDKEEAKKNPLPSPQPEARQNVEGTESEGHVSGEGANGDKKPLTKAEQQESLKQLAADLEPGLIDKILAETQDKSNQDKPKGGDDPASTSQVELGDTGISGAGKSADTTTGAPKKTADGSNSATPPIPVTSASATEGKQPSPDLTRNDVSAKKPKGNSKRRENALNAIKIVGLTVTSPVWGAWWIGNKAKDAWDDRQNTPATPTPTVVTQKPAPNTGENAVGVTPPPAPTPDANNDSKRRDLAGIPSGTRASASYRTISSVSGSVNSSTESGDDDEVTIDAKKKKIIDQTTVDGFKAKVVEDTTLAPTEGTTTTQKANKNKYRHITLEPGAEKYNYNPADSHKPTTTTTTTKSGGDGIGMGAAAGGGIAAVIGGAILLGPIGALLGLFCLFALVALASSSSSKTKTITTTQPNALKPQLDRSRTNEISQSQGKDRNFLQEELNRRNKTTTGVTTGRNSQK
jgi:uncharacterized protein YjbI with pentapeptide repeats